MSRDTDSLDVKDHEVDCKSSVDTRDLIGPCLFSDDDNEDEEAGCL